MPKDYLDLLPRDAVQLGLLSDGEGVNKDFGASCDRHFEGVAILLNF